MARSKKLLSSLTPQDVITLDDGVAAGANSEEKEKAEQVLKKVVQAGSAVARRAPGPKRQSATNPTEKNIRHLKRNIRTILGTCIEGYSDLELLCFLLDLYKQYKILCRTGLFLKESDRAKVRSAQIDCNSAETAVFLHDLEESISDWVESFSKDNKFSWSDLLKRTSNSLSTSISTEEKSAYQSLKAELNIGSEENQLSRTVLLEAAIAQLDQIRTVLENSWYLLISSEIEALYETLREFNYHPSNSLAIRPLGDLEEVFLTAIARQGKNPFSAFKNEELEAQAAEKEDFSVPGISQGTDKQCIRIIRSAPVAGCRCTRWKKSGVRKRELYCTEAQARRTRQAANRNRCVAGYPKFVPQFEFSRHNSRYHRQAKHSRRNGRESYSRNRRSSSYLRLIQRPFTKQNKSKRTGYLRRSVRRLVL